MKRNKKGMTMVEIIVSISLISIVLVFLMNLFLKVRSVYNQSKMQADYDMLVSTITKAVGMDIENYGLKSAEFIGSENDTVLLTFNAFRPTKLSDPIKKMLKVYFDYETNNYVISYAYQVCSPTKDDPLDAYCTPNITSAEKSASEIRTVPNSDEVVMDSSHYISLTEKNNIVKIKIPISNSKGTIYDINIYGVIEED